MYCLKKRCEGKEYLRAGWQGEDSDLFCFLLFFLASVNKTLWGRPIKSSFVLSSQFNASSYGRLKPTFELI